MSEEVKEPQGSEELVSGTNTDLVSVGMELERARQLEAFVSGTVYPRYKLAADLVSEKFHLREKEMEAGKGEVIKINTKIRKLRDAIEQEPKRAEEIVKKVKELRAKRKEITDKVREATKENRKTITQIKKAIKEKDEEVQRGLRLLGYQL